MIATAGIAAAMIMATGCSSKAPAETTPSQTEAAAGTTEAETDSQEVETGEAPGTSAEETTEEGVEVDIPLKISGLIHSVDGNEIVADNQSENSAQGDMILMVDENSTFILDPDGMPVDLADVKEGKFEAYLGPAMTISIRGDRQHSRGCSRSSVPGSSRCGRGKGWQNHFDSHRWNRI